MPLTNHAFHPLAGDHDAMSFVRLCRRDMAERERRRAQREAEALLAARSDPPFDPLGEGMPEMFRRAEDR